MHQKQSKSVNKETHCQDHPGSEPSTDQKAKNLQVNYNSLKETIKMLSIK